MSLNDPEILSLTCCKLSDYKHGCGVVEYLNIIMGYLVITKLCTSY